MQSSGISSPGTGRHPPFPSPATLTRKRFALTGRSHSFDPRIDAARGDLADLRLAERIFAPHYAVATARTANLRTPLLTSPRGDTVSEVLQGEDFEVLELSGDYAWGVSAVDGAVGFVQLAALAAPIRMTHIVCVREAGGLPMGTRVVGAAGLDGDAIRPLDAPVADFVGLAEALVGVPERPGGRSGAGVDCTGLVFLTLALAGIRAPRFCNLQAATLGRAIDPDAPALRGDLLYFADHAAIVADGDTVIHVADGAVRREAITEVIAGGAFGPLAARRRLS